MEWGFCEAISFLWLTIPLRNESLLRGVLHEKKKLASKEPASYESKKTLAKQANEQKKKKNFVIIFVKLFTFEGILFCKWGWWCWWCRDILVTRRTNKRILEINKSRNEMKKRRRKRICNTHMKKLYWNFLYANDTKDAYPCSSTRTPLSCGAHHLYAKFPSI